MEQQEIKLETLKKVIIEQMNDFNTEVVTLLTLDTEYGELLALADIFDTALYLVSYFTGNYPNSIDEYVEFIENENNDYENDEE